VVAVELAMFRSLPKRALLSWLLGRLGPPPPPPRRHFGKSWDSPHHKVRHGHGQWAGRHGSGGRSHPAGG
jgi:hypothetical protein